MLVLATLFENLPAATLGAIVIDAMVGLITLDAFQRYYRVNRVDWVFFVGAGLGILVFGIMAGILIGVVLSLVMLIARSRAPTSDASIATPRQAATTTSRGTADWSRSQGS